MEQYEKDPHILRYESAEEIMGKIRDYILTHTDKINDFSTGSALETILEAFATELEVYYQLSVTNIKGSIDNAIYSAFNLNRIPETRAYGTFIIDFGEPTESPLEVPSGVTFSSSHPSYNQTYSTIETYDVPQGTTSFEVTGYCNQGGKYGNIPARQINNIDNFPDADSVVNPTSISTGHDSESLTSVKIRFRNLIQSLQRGTVQAVQYGAKTVPNITGAFVDESVGYVRVYCHDANGDLPLPLQKQAQREMINWRPAGIPVEVLPVHKTVVDVGVTLDVPNLALHTVQLREAVRKSITNYINSRQTGQDLVMNNIVAQIMDLGGLGIDNTQVNLYVHPSETLVDSEYVNSHNNIIYNEHMFNKKLFAPQSNEFNAYLAANRADLVPKDRSRFNAYVHTHGDYDNPPYLSNAHGDGYLNADVDGSIDTTGELDSNADNTAPDPLPSMVSNNLSSYKSSLISSMDSSATSAGHLFETKEASSYADSVINNNGIKASISDSVYSSMQSSLEASISYDDVASGKAYQSDSASSEAVSIISSMSSDKASMSSYSNPTDSNNTQTSQFPLANSAGDATPEHALQVQNKYMTRGNEILRAGSIVVDYNTMPNAK